MSGTTPRLSRMAVAGLVLGIATYPLAFAAFLMIGPCHPPTDWRGTAGPLLGVLAIGSLGIGFLLSVVSLFRIAVSRAKLWGLAFSILGVLSIAPVAWLIVSQL